MRRVEPLLRALLEAVPDDPLEARLDVLIGRRQIRGVFAQDRRHRFGRRVAVESPRAREHLVENRSEGKDVAPPVGRLALDLFGRHVAEGAQDHAGLGPASVERRQVRLRPRRALRLRQLRESEVEDFDPAVAGDEEVLRLQVAVDDSLLVRGGESFGRLDRVIRRLPYRKRSAREPAAERFPLEKLRDDVGRALMRAELVDGRDVGVVQRAGRLRFLLEPAKPFRVLRERRRQDLDRDVTLEARVLRPVHLSHPAGPDRRQDLVGSQLGADDKGHGLAPGEGSQEIFPLSSVGPRSGPHRV